jgi:CRISPR-associated endonuclease Cas1
MRAQATDSLAAWPTDLVPSRGILVLSGYGLDVRVCRGRLRVADGVGRSRREAIVHRATGRLRRLVVLGHTGCISLEAVRWLADVGAGYIQIDADGRVLAAFGPSGADRPGLRRAQARALDTPIGVDIARRLIAEKIAAQSETLVGCEAADMTDETLDGIRGGAARVHVAAARDDVRFGEATAAAAYWSALALVPIRFARRDEGTVPAHWLTLGARSSPLTGGPRLAVNPANALLNYLYALLEGEATIAARTVGLDSGLGVLHADQMNGDSLSADLMEPVRPHVDRYVLDLLTRRSFAADDFYETRQGVCRVTPPLATELAQTLPDWRVHVGRVAEDVARLLGGDHSDSRQLATPVSERNRSAGRGAKSKHPRRRGPAVATACEWCGSGVRAGRRTCSSGCLAELERANRPEFVRAGVEALTKLRASGWKRQLTPEGRARIGSNPNARGTEAARAWQRENPWPTDMGAFAREILPGLRAATARDLAAATGLSVGYCRTILKGVAVPHPMWWEALRALSARVEIDLAHRPLMR